MGKRMTQSMVKRKKRAVQQQGADMNNGKLQKYFLVLFVFIWIAGAAVLVWLCL